MTDPTLEPNHANTTIRVSRRKLAGLASALALAGSAISLTAAGHHDHDKDEDDDDRDHGRDDHDDHSGHDDGHDDRDDDDDPGRDPVKLADGSWEVRIADDDEDAFLPGSIAILPGETVTWVNDDDKPHTATGGDWDTGTIEPGASASITFDAAGSFAYACQFHPIMTGTVVVGDPVASPEASPIADSTPGSVDVRIFNLAYEPNTIEVPVGTAVTWTNDDTLIHTVTSDDGLFDSNSIDGEGTFSHTFDTPGTYPYSCMLHAGMRGTVVVV